MIRQIRSFCSRLLIIICVIFLIHTAILKYLDYPIFDDLIIQAYIVNFILAVIIFIALIKLKENYLHLLGFVFMIGSLVKFAVFFIFFHGSLRADGEITRLETTSFLVPYLACLFIETLYLSKLLNNKM